MKLLSRPLNSRLFQVNLVSPLRKITLLLGSSLLFKNNSTLHSDLSFEITYPFRTPLLKGFGEGIVQVLNVSNICFTCHVSQKQTKNNKQLTESFLKLVLKLKKKKHVYSMCNKQEFSKLAVQYVTEASLTYEAANSISHINSQELTSS